MRNWQSISGKRTRQSSPTWPALNRFVSPENLGVRVGDHKIPPGGSTTVKVLLGSIDQPTMRPPLRPEWLVGLMRIDLALCRRYSPDSDECDSMPAKERVSNAFLVTY